MTIEPATFPDTAVPAMPKAAPDSAGSGARFARVVRIAGLIGVLLSLASAGVTFFVLTGLTRVEPTPEVVLVTMLVNGGLVTLLALAVAWEIGTLLVARKRGRAASRLHIRIVALVGFIAAAPAVVLTITASTTLDRGLDNWFSVRTRAIVDNSLSIARAYAGQQIELLRSDMRSAKAELEGMGDLLAESPDQFDVFFRSIALDQRLSGAYLIKGDGDLVREAPFSRIDIAPPGPGILAEASQQPDRVFMIPPRTGNIIGAVTQLVGHDDLFLYGSRPLSSDTARYLAMTNASIQEYRSLEATRSNMQIAFAILFLGITLVVLLSAIWLGIGFANRLVAPIRRLIDAANEVSRGNLAVEVTSHSADGDVGSLGATFNEMTSQLRSQRDELISTSEQMDRRRLFTEAVLSGVTAGVVGTSAEGVVTIANRTVLEWLGVKEEEVRGKMVTVLIPQLGPVISVALRDGRPEHRDQIALLRNGRERTVNVRVTTERSEGQSQGYVITLDDITDLVTAQRSSAWADIARRIAHEIKNPLTPIQLSAERLKRKFGRVIADDRDVFDQCTDTIIRQVGDIGRMVDEFSSFAQMPKPRFKIGSLTTIIRESVFLISVSKPDMEFDIQLADEPLTTRFDARLIGQALANVVKNATEAIESAQSKSSRKGQIRVVGRRDGAMVAIDVIDNGIGLPAQDRRKLLEPYMTTREKGTGLGLAIVTKIVEDHSGRIELLDAPEVATGGQGAMVRISLPFVEIPPDAEPTAKDIPALNKTQAQR
jgi:two-component system nitrogen regulation sensor histidine kinase NtrY